MRSNWELPICNGSERLKKNGKKVHSTQKPEALLHRILLAMKRAIKKLKKKPSHVLIDGNKLPNIKNYKLKSIIKGDQKIPSISAASIIAKVTRDKVISDLGKKFKGYNWQKNFGYGTSQHLKAIKILGITKHHRKTFSPINKLK